MNRAGQETLSGLIERVTFHNPENGFSVLKVRTRDVGDPETVLATLTMVTAGEHLEARGRWVVDREHGRQFQAESVRTTHPETAEGIEKFLGSGLIKGLGPGLAGRIVRLYKDRSLEILDQFPEVLLHIKGISGAKLRTIRASWSEQKAVREIAVFLQSHGLGPARAVRIYRQYGLKAVETIRENPYTLADDIRGIGFKTADDLAKQLGLDPRSPYRAKAAVRYALQQLTSEGHCGFPEGGVVERTAALADLDADLVRTAIEELVTAGDLVRETVEGSPAVFLAALHRAECGVAESLSRLADGRHPAPKIDVEAALAWVEKKLSLELAEQQREAIRQACRHPVLVVTGGPGVGKTTLVRSLLEIFTAKKLKCVLAAPTGRAARRMTEATGRPAQTIHRLLAFDPASGEFSRGYRQPLQGDVFVVDEVSMVDVVLAHQFLRSVPTGAVVVLVGDVDQLPSVGPGTFLTDVIGSGLLPVVRLTQIFRQAQESRIVSAAYAVHQGRLPESSGKAEPLSDFYTVVCETPQETADMLLRLVRERIPERFGFDPRTEIQVLTPMNRGPLGARALNVALQARLNPANRQGSVERFGTTFRVGDRVIQTENNYDRDVFNGDMGVIERTDDEEQELTVRFGERPVLYDFGDLDELSLAYALTIHKSQGSEYPCVVIPLHTQHFVMLQRNLLYTAITRGKRLVVIVGPKAALEVAVSREDLRRRFTRLRQRLRLMDGAPMITESPRLGKS